MVIKDLLQSDKLGSRREHHTRYLSPSKGNALNPLLRKPMTINVDSAIDAAGGLARFQVVATALLSWPHCISGLQAMLWVFTGTEPAFQAAMCPIVHFPMGILGKSATVDWELVCEKQYQATLISSAFFFGFMLGTIALGSFSDAYGRRPALLISMACSQLAAAGCAIAPDPLFFAVARVLGGVGVGGMGLVAFVWNAELVGRHRYILALSTNLAFAIGVCVLTYTAWRMPFWRDQCWAIFWYGLPNFAIALWVPDSPKWLDSMSRTTEAKKVIEYIANFNSQELPKMPEEAKPSGTKHDVMSPLELIRSPMRTRFMVLCYAFLSCALCYFGLALNSQFLSSNLYLANALGACVEVPAYVVVFFGVDNPLVGRRRLTTCCLLIAGAACLVATLAKPLSNQLLAAAMLARFSIAGANAVLYLWAAELVPTGVRAVALGVLSMTARLAAVVSPFVFAYCGSPLVVVGLPALIAGIVARFLPETVGRPMPDSIEDIIDEEMLRLLPAASSPAITQRSRPKTVV